MFFRRKWCWQERRRQSQRGDRHPGGYGGNRGSEGLRHRWEEMAHMSPMCSTMARAKGMMVTAESEEHAGGSGQDG